MKVMAEGAKQALARQSVAGMIALGGGGGTSVACAALRELRLGIPKIMVSTLASGDISQWVGTSDIVMIPSIVDIAGLNRISRRGDRPGGECALRHDRDTRLTIAQTSP